MAQQESALGSQNGVLLLRDATCATPDLSRAVWKVTPNWKPDPQLRCLGMSAEEADLYEEMSNPWGDAQQVNDDMDALSAQLRGLPLEELAAMPQAQQRAFARQLQQQQQSSPAALEGRAGPKIVQLPKGVLYVGAVDGRSRPHGEGELMLRDGSVHAGPRIPAARSVPGSGSEGPFSGPRPEQDRNKTVNCDTRTWLK